MIFQISTMMHETWIGIENYQIVIVFCVYHSLLTPYCWREQSCIVGYLLQNNKKNMVFSN
jgi:hypothetical protein